MKQASFIEDSSLVETLDYLTVFSKVTNFVENDIFTTACVIKL